jgi:3-deoxy-D-manno-octulosonate 8-phosphate phosphatase (KDO 8-P phosphatase)
MPEVRDAQDQPKIDAKVARRIRLVGFDVDGVLTDGGIYLGDVDKAPMEFKRYDIQDGIGMVLLRYVGLKVVIVTGRVSASVAMRARELNVDDFAQDPDARKLPAFERILARFGIASEDAAFVGDDLPDVPILERVGLPVAVHNAVPEVARMCAVNLAGHGGRGAVREFCELLLKARGEWELACQRYLAERSGSTPVGLV